MKIQNDKLLSIENKDIVSGVLTIPENIRHIEREACAYKSILKSVIFPEGLESIEQQAFANSGIENIEIPDTVTEIGMGAFANSQLVEAKLPKGLECIPAHLFDNCFLLEKVTMGNSVKVILDYAFCKCKNLNIINFSPTLCKINKFAFSECDFIASLDFRKTKLNSISEYAFLRCNNLSEILFPSRALTLEKGSFAHCVNLQKFDFSNINVIPEECFEKCVSLTDIDLATIKIIEDKAFKSCVSIQELTIPYNTIKIAEEAFARCNQIKLINISNNPYRTVSTTAFDDCNSVELLRYDTDFSEYSVFGNVSNYI